MLRYELVCNNARPVRDRCSRLFASTTVREISGECVAGCGVDAAVHATLPRRRGAINAANALDPAPDNDSRVGRDGPVDVPKLGTASSSRLRMGVGVAGRLERRVVLLSAAEPSPDAAPAGAPRPPPPSSLAAVADSDDSCLDRLAEVMPRPVEMAWMCT